MLLKVIVYFTLASPQTATVKEEYLPLSEKDTSNLHYYSFAKKEIIDLQDYLSNATVITLKACESGSIILAGPEIDEPATYEWHTPQAIVKKGKELYLKNISETDEGVYHVYYKTKTSEGIAKIRLVVSPLPEVSIGFTEFIQGDKMVLTASSDNSELKYTWNTSSGQLLSKLNRCELPFLRSGYHLIYLQTENQGCTLQMEIPVKIKAQKFASKNDLVQILRNFE